MLVCRKPDKRDSLLLSLGIFSRDSLYDRVVSKRYFKYNSSNYSLNDIKDAFATDLNKCFLRTDGLFECYSSKYNSNYYSISDSKKSFGWIGYRPEFRASICENNLSNTAFGPYFQINEIAEYLSIDTPDTANRIFRPDLSILFHTRLDSLSKGKEIPSSMDFGTNGTYRIKTRTNNSASIWRCASIEDSVTNCKYLTEIHVSGDLTYLFGINANCDQAILASHSKRPGKRKQK